MISTRGRARRPYSVEAHDRGYPRVRALLLEYGAVERVPHEGLRGESLLTRGIVLTRRSLPVANARQRQYGSSPLGADAVDAPGNTRSGGTDVGSWGETGTSRARTSHRAGPTRTARLAWGIAVIARTAAGAYPGDSAGTFSATWSAKFPFGSRIFRVSYPASGPFNSAPLGYGGYLCYCDQRWDGETNNDWCLHRIHATTSSRLRAR